MSNHILRLFQKHFRVLTVRYADLCAFLSLDKPVIKLAQTKLQAGQFYRRRIELCQVQYEHVFSVTYQIRLLYGQTQLWRMIQPGPYCGQYGHVCQCRAQCSGWQFFSLFDSGHIIRYLHPLQLLDCTCTSSNPPSSSSAPGVSTGYLQIFGNC